MPRKLGSPRPATISRRTFLKGSAAAGAAIAGGAMWTTAIHPSRARAADTPIEHIIVACQENRSFDHYFGYAPQVQAAGFGPPPGYSQPNPGGDPDPVEPYRFTELETPDVPHDWGSVHGQWDGGAMDGFMTHSGIWAMGYYTEQELPFYYGLFEDSTLCANFFCSLLGPTWPNRFYLMAGTSGGITTNGQWGYGIFDYPMILDLLDAAGVSWKIYNVSWDSVPFGNTDNVAVFWKKFAHDSRTRGNRGAFLNDLRKDRLPQVSFIIPSFARGWDEHPPASVGVGMGIQEQLVSALRESAAWQNSAYIITYDEHGGYFDHVSPPQVDAFGLGVRIPTWVISPWAKPGHLEPAVYDLTSILKFIERVFGLGTLAAVNHRFDTATPVGGDYQAAAPGAAAGPPAPPRDDRSDIGDLFECFTF
jgi:phospholipase C